MAMFYLYNLIIAADAEGVSTCFSCGICFLDIGIYIFVSLALMGIANRLGLDDKSWWAWVPFLNLLLLIEMAGAPLWYILLMFIPIVNLVVMVMIWISICQARGKPGWWGALMLVPIANFIMMGFLAWAD